LNEYGRRSVRKGTGGLIAQDGIVAPGGDESSDYALSVLMYQQERPIHGREDSQPKRRAVPGYR
jgi:hypothetical protein